MASGTDTAPPNPSADPGSTGASVSQPGHAPGGAETTPDLPAVPEDITASWLSKVLGTKVSSVERTKIVPGTATKVFVTVTYEEDEEGRPEPLPTRLCIKGGFDPAFIQSMPYIVPIYQREVEFFNQVAPSLRGHLGLPASRWAGLSAKQGIVIMDDLAAAAAADNDNDNDDKSGCAFGNPVHPWPLERVKAGVEQLAVLHARTLGVTPETYPWLTPHYDEVMLTLTQSFDAVVKGGADRPEGIPAYLKDQPRIREALRKHYGSRNPKFRCLLHGDAHTGNTYLEGGPDGAAPRFLDWQIIHIGSAFHDVSYFIAGALTVGDRRAHEWEVVDHYLATLHAHGAPRFSRGDEDVVREYRKSFMSGVGWLMCPYSMQAKECVDAMAVRYAAALDDHKVLELLESLPEPAS
ncbi:kinase-like domain-containing protein [Xylariomycetidae sp. FL2044]|nr:kinase-like domain-containing protein [Xylariomycetidae sp. FL2044]